MDKPIKVDLAAIMAEHAATAEPTPPPLEHPDAAEMDARFAVAQFEAEWGTPRSGREERAARCNAIGYRANNPWLTPDEALIGARMLAAWRPADAATYALRLLEAR